MSPITIVSVTFSGDARLSVLQALSVDRLFPVGEIDEYLLVLNDPDPAALESFFRRHLAGRVSPELWAKIRFLAPSDIVDTSGTRGQRSQQLVKLHVSRLVRTEHYLLLDAKNMFVRPTTIDDFWLGGRIRTQVKPVTSYWLPYVTASLDILGVPSDGAWADTSMPTITPYLMITSDVRGLLEDLSDRVGDAPAAAWEVSHGKATEFYLYYAYLVKIYGEEVPYVHSTPVCHTLFTTWPQEHDKALEMIQATSTDDLPMFGVHRARLPQLSRVQTGALHALWGEHLLAKWEDANWFLQPEYTL